MVVLNGDEIGFDILNKYATTSTTRLNDAQQMSYEYVVKYGIQKTVEMSKFIYCRVGSELYIFNFERVVTDKPARVEINGVLHNTSVTECLNRETTYLSPFYVGLSMYVFSEKDPRIANNRHALIQKMKEKVRIASKAKRIRIDQFEVSAVHNLERKKILRRNLSKLDGLLEKGENYNENDLDNADDDGDVDDDVDDDDDEGENSEILCEEDFQGNFSTDDPKYSKKLQQAYDACRMYPEERNKYKFLLEKVTWPKHALIELPVMPDSILCHGMDDLANNQGCMYSSGGNFIYNGRERPWIMSYRSKYSSNFLSKDSNCVENRSAHPISKLRSSSSTLLVNFVRDKKTNHDRMVWDIPYVNDFQLPWSVLFKACGIVDTKQLTNLILFCVENYFRDSKKSIPMDQIKQLIQWSIDFNERKSELIQTQEDAWIFIGKLSDKHLDEEVAEELISGPPSKNDENDDDKHKNNTDSRNNNNNNNNKRKRIYINNNPKPANYICRDENKEWARKGRATICKEILPHVGCDPRLGRDSEFWKLKAFHLATMSTKLLLDKVRVFTNDPESFLSYDLKDEIANRCIETMSEWLLNKLIRPTINWHIKTARREIYNCLLHEQPIDPKTCLDHKRPSNQIDTAISTGIMRTRMNPALAASRNGNNNQFQDNKRNSNNNAGGLNNKKAKDRTGITQIQNNTNILSIWSLQSRISGNLQSAGAGASSTARAILDHWGTIDFTETPDGEACGRVNPHALSARVSIDAITDDLISQIILKHFPIIPINDIVDKAVNAVGSRCNKNENNAQQILYQINLNDRCIGLADKCTTSKISSFLKRRRYVLMGNSFMGVSNPIETRTLEIHTIGGRLVRALLVASKVKRLLSPTNQYDSRPLFVTMTWDMMLREGFIEYIDKREEQNDALIMSNVNDMIKLFTAIDKNAKNLSLNYNEKKKIMASLPFTHCEIKPVLILGICSSQIPFAQQNQGPRDVYASAMAKQAMASIHLNTAVRLDTLMHTLCFASKPLVYTETLQWFRAESASPTFLAFIAFLCNKGKTVEDALCMNAASGSRGIGRSEQTAVLTVKEKKSNYLNNVESFFQRADRFTTVGMKTQSYEDLDVDGAPFPGCLKTENDIIISRVGKLDDNERKTKYKNHKNLANMKYYDNSMSTPKKYEGIVMKTIKTSDNQGRVKIRVQTKKVCPPIKGDKFCVTPDHEILTKNGWKTFEELTMIDEIACLDAYNCLGYYHPTAIYRFGPTEDEGDMLYNVESPHVSLMTTMNHKMWVSINNVTGINDDNDAQFQYGFELLEAKSIWESGIQNVTYAKNAFNKCSYCFQLIIDEELNLKYDTLESINRWLLIFSDFARVDFVGVWQPSDNDYFPTQNEYKYFAKSFKNMNICSWISQLGVFQSRKLLSLLLNGSEKSIIQTYSKEFANAIQQLALHAEYSADIETTQDSLLFSITINTLQTQNKPLVNSDEHTSIQKNYQGLVYCVEVPTHIFYVRRNGKCSWTGNSSRHAQKTVCGSIVKEVDMVRSSRGLIPDFVFNPNGIPSRMTVAHLIEALAGNAAAVYATRINGTSFSQSYKLALKIAQEDFEFLQESGYATGDCLISSLNNDGLVRTQDEKTDNIIRIISNALKKKGFSPYGTQIFYNGETGERLGKMGSRARGAGEVFVGPMSMYRLIHRAEDKSHARANGPRHILTRQPVEGGCRNGGYRVGEMERDCIIVHGASCLLRERHHLVSDPFASYICSGCGISYQPQFKDKLFFCSNCGTEENTGVVPLTYTFKLLVQHLQSACIFPRYKCENV